MAVSSDSAHPMIEPLDYRLTPERAAAELQGEHLALYSLIWRGALATQVEGPALVNTVIELVAGSGAEPSATDVRLRIHGLDPLYPADQDDSWALLLPDEVAVQARLAGLQGEPLPDVLRQAIEALGPGQLDGQGWRTHDDAACAPIKALLAAPSAWRATLRPGADPYGFDRLLCDMSEKKVGRPSTYAGGIARTLDKGLLGYDPQAAAMDLQLAGNGASLLDKVLASSNTGADRVDADFSRDLAAALEAVERDPTLAGATLSRFSQRALGFEASALAAWLDALEIEGESLDEALARAERSLPLANSWDTLQLPAGLVPSLLCEAPQALLEARERLDHYLAEPDRPAWKALDDRQRAARRLHLLAGQGSLADWIAASARDLVLRWWIDLAPQEHPLSSEELAACPALHLEDQAPLQALVADIIFRLALPAPVTAEVVR